MRETRRGSGGGGRRQLKVRLKTARQRSASSQRWLERQLNDPYVAAAKHEGYRSRAAYKLIEIDDRHHVLKPGARVIDLGATPGGWGQVAAQRVRSIEGKGQVVAIDLLPMEALAGVEFLLLDFLDPLAPARTWCSPTWQRKAPATLGPTIFASWPWPRRPRNLRAKCWSRVAPSSARCSRAAPSRHCWGA